MHHAFAYHTALCTPCILSGLSDILYILMYKCILYVCINCILYVCINCILYVCINCIQYVCINCIIWYYADCSQLPHHTCMCAPSAPEQVEECARKENYAWLVLLLVTLVQITAYRHIPHTLDYRRQVIHPKDKLMTMKFGSWILWKSLYVHSCAHVDKI